MPEEEFIISGLRIDDDIIIVSLSVTNVKERMEQLVKLALRKWAKQYGKQMPLPENYKAQIIGGGVPPMIMNLPLAKWANKGLQLNDRVIINVPETIDDIILVKKKDELGV